MSRRRSQSKTEAALKISPAAFLLLVLLMTGGDIRKFPAMLNQALSLLLVAAVIAVIGLIAFLVFRKLRSRSLPDGSQNPQAPTPDEPHKLYSREPRFPKPSRPSQQLEAIDWFQFEKTIGRLMELEGWTVEMRGGAQEDGGVDLIATRGAETHLVQCKYWKSWDLNLRTVRELVGARESAEFKSRNASAWIYTLSDPTERALKFASENAVGIVARTELERRLDAHPLSAFPELANPDNPPPADLIRVIASSAKAWIEKKKKQTVPEQPELSCGTLEEAIAFVTHCQGLRKAGPRHWAKVHEFLVGLRQQEAKPVQVQKAKTGTRKRKAIPDVAGQTFMFEEKLVAKAQ